MGAHIGRSWDGPGDVEALCPCPKAPCGLVDVDNVSDECTQHPPLRCKTIRTGHPEDDCPEIGRDVVVAMKRTAETRQAVVDAAAMGEPEGCVNASLFDAIDDYRAAVEHEAAERIRNSERLRDYTDDHMGDCNAAADAIDPDVEETT
ncbi:hypothetical protein [Streptomyces californicus]|uniref:hypothetical protein n=1 Tax=Streptomyces californicus TaxID=67351 RepID=UPI0005164826|nr:hypothetical protein [Streptomyces californicus]QRV53488.1 hypothetical protein I6J40_04205 [Streptomyces californicus]